MKRILIGLLVLLSFSSAAETIKLLEPSEEEILVICNNTTLEWRNIVMANEDLYDGHRLTQTTRLQELMFIRIYTHIIDRTLSSNKIKLSSSQHAKLKERRDQYDALYLKDMIKITYGNFRAKIFPYMEMLGAAKDPAELHKNNLSHYRKLINSELEIPYYVELLKSNHNYVCQRLSRNLNEEFKILEL